MIRRILQLNYFHRQLTLVKQVRDSVVEVILFTAGGNVSGYDVALERGQVVQIVAKRDKHLAALRSKLGMVELFDKSVVLRVFNT